MAQPFRFAVIGTGDISHYYLKCFLKHPEREGLEFAGAWNRTREKADSFVGEYGGRIYGSLKELLADRGVDAVVNLTSAQAHEEFTRAALEAGKHVQSEKPLALTLERALELEALARRQGVVLSVAPFILLGHNQRLVKSLLDQGQIGRPVSVTAELFHGRVESWHPSPQQFYRAGAGPVLDVGPYPVSLLLAWFGPVREVQAMFDIALPERVDLQGRRFQVETFDQGVALLRFQCGVIARLAFSFANAKSAHAGMEIQGTAGSLCLASFMNPRGELRLATADSPDWSEVHDQDSSEPIDWSGGIFELARAVREGREPANSAALARRTLEVLLAITEAAKWGATVRLIRD